MPPRSCLATTLTLLAMLATVHVGLARAAVPDSTGARVEDYAELDLESLTQLDVVVGATRFEQSLAEAPAAVTVIGQAELRAAGYETLGEVLAGVRGFFLTDDRNYQYVGVRGFARPGDYNSRVLILIDGHRVNDELIEQGALGRDGVIDLQLVERIEIIRGPSSSLYGSDAIFAVVNLITRAAPDGLHGSIGAGGRGATRLRLRGGSPADAQVRWLAGGEYFRTDGEPLRFAEFASAANPSGLSERGDREYAAHGFAKLMAGRTVALAAISTRAKGIPTASFASLFGDTRSETWDTRALFDLQHRIAMHAGSELAMRGFYDLFDYHGDYPYVPDGVADTVISSDRQSAQWAGAELRYAAPPWRGHRALAGAEGRWNLRALQRVWDREPEFTYYEERGGSDVRSAFLQDEWRITPWLTAHGAIRRDDRGRRGHSDSPRAALLVTPFAGTTLKLLYGRAFRAPTPYELTYDDGGISQKRNPDLGTERSRTREAVLEHEVGPDTRGSVTLYETQVTGLIEQVNDPTDSLDVFVNRDGIRARGLEFEAMTRPRPGIQLRGSYSYQSVRQLADLSWLSNSPRHLAAATALLDLPGDHGRLALELQYVSPRRTLAGAVLPSYVVSHLRLSDVRITPACTAWFRVRNLLDARYATSGGPEHVQDQLPAPRRSWLVGIEFGH